MLAWSSTPVPFTEPDHDRLRLVEVVLSRNGETHIDDPQDAANVIHRFFPLAPIPVRLTRIDSGRDLDGGDLGCTWMVALDPGSTQAIQIDETWFKAQLSDPFGTVEIEVPQP